MFILPIVAASVGVVSPSADRDALVQSIVSSRFDASRMASLALAGFTVGFDAQLTDLAKRVPNTPEVRRRLTNARAVGLARATQFFRSEDVPGMIAIVADAYRNEFSTEELREAAAFWSSPAARATQALVAGSKNQAYFAEVDLEGIPEAQRYFASHMGRREAAVDARVGPRLAAYSTASGRKLQSIVVPLVDAALAGR